jgi:hypothetical protein
LKSSPNFAWNARSFSSTLFKPTVSA